MLLLFLSLLLCFSAVRAWDGAGALILRHACRGKPGFLPPGYGSTGRLRVLVGCCGCVAGPASHRRGASGRGRFCGRSTSDVPWTAAGALLHRATIPPRRWSSGPGRRGDNPTSHPVAIYPAVVQQPCIDPSAAVPRGWPRRIDGLAGSPKGNHGRYRGSPCLKARRVAFLAGNSPGWDVLASSQVSQVLGQRLITM